MPPVHEAPSLKRPGAFSRFKLWWGPHPLAQVLGLAALLCLFALLAGNTAESLSRAGIAFGFDFLTRAANFEIGESAVRFSAGDTYLRAIIAGLANTVQVALPACILATLLGVSLGISLLSGNLLLAGLARAYVEIIRNTPLLLQLFFWIALAKSLPPPRSAISAWDAIYLSNRGMFLPGLMLRDVTGPAMIAGFVLVAAFVSALVLLARRRMLSSRRAALAGVVLISALAVVGGVTGAHLDAEVPALAGFNIRGGMSLTPEFAALLVGLTVKFSAMTAEIVRAGVQSVSPGQIRAARALGLGEGQILRHVVFPQALRIITPPTTSAYLDLTKDSSLAVAIGYPDLVSVINTSANTTGQSLEALTILLAIFLAINLSVSALMDVYNRRVALRGSGPA